MLTVAARAALVACCALAAACSLAYLQHVARWQEQSFKVMVFGGPGDTTYLGCLNCLASDSESVLNPEGPYGSGGSTTSIANPTGPFGSPTSPYSACNPFATEPPVIVDDQGNDYGRITVDRSRSDGSPGNALQRWIDRLCAGAHG